MCTLQICGNWTVKFHCLNKKQIKGGNRRGKVDDEYHEHIFCIKVQFHFLRKYKERTNQVRLSLSCLDSLLTLHCPQEGVHSSAQPSRFFVVWLCWPVLFLLNLEQVQKASSLILLLETFLRMLPSLCPPVSPVELFQFPAQKSRPPWGFLDLPCQHQAQLYNPLLCSSCLYASPNFSSSYPLSPIAGPSMTWGL